METKHGLIVSHCTSDLSTDEAMSSNSFFALSFLSFPWIDSIGQMNASVQAGLELSSDAGRLTGASGPRGSPCVHGWHRIGTGRARPPDNDAGRLATCRDRATEDPSSSPSTLVRAPAMHGGANRQAARATWPRTRGWRPAQRDGRRGGAVAAVGRDRRHSPSPARRDAMRGTGQARMHR